MGSVGLAGRQGTGNQCRNNDRDCRGCPPHTPGNLPSAVAGRETECRPSQISAYHLATVAWEMVAVMLRWGVETFQSVDPQAERWRREERGRGHNRRTH